jgi:hypothetical protein
MALTQRGERLNHHTVHFALSRRGRLTSGEKNQREGLGAVATGGELGQGRALDWGGVDHQDVVLPQVGVSGQQAD